MTGYRAFWRSSVWALACLGVVGAGILLSMTVCLAVAIGAGVGVPLLRVAYVRSEGGNLATTSIWDLGVAGIFASIAALAVVGLLLLLGAMALLIGFVVGVGSPPLVGRLRSLVAWPPGSGVPYRSTEFS